MTEQLAAFLGPDLLRLINDGQILLNVKEECSDYSFAVFPFAKAYEGFLKKLFLQIGAIDQHTFESDHWRVGKALNPQLEKDLRHSESVYDRIAEFCSGTELPETLWQAWKRGRNQIFHYFPGKFQVLSQNEAKEVSSEIMKAMESALTDCKLT